MLIGVCCATRGARWPGIGSLRDGDRRGSDGLSVDEVGLRVAVFCEESLTVLFRRTISFFLS